MAERKMKSKKTWEKDEEIEISNSNGIEETDVSPSLEDVEFEEIVEEAKEKLGVVNCARLNVRVSPVNGKVMKTYKNGTRFDTYEIRDNWARTPSGWVCLDYCKLVYRYNTQF